MGLFDADGRVGITRSEVIEQAITRRFISTEPSPELFHGPSFTAAGTISSNGRDTSVNFASKSYIVRSSFSPSMIVEERGQQEAKKARENLQVFTATDHTAGSDITRLRAWGEGKNHENQENQGNYEKHENNEN